MAGDEGRRNRAHVREMPAQPSQRRFGLREQQARYVASLDFPTFQSEVRDDGHGLRPQSQRHETGAGKERWSPKKGKERVGGRR
jgi:hypothetical protein